MVSKSSKQTSFIAYSFVFLALAFGVIIDDTVLVVAEFIVLMMLIFMDVKFYREMTKMDHEFEMLRMKIRALKR